MWKNNKRENVLFITADQWLEDSLVIVGHPVSKTPNLDLLSKERVLFRKHYA